MTVYYLSSNLVIPLLMAELLKRGVTEFTVTQAALRDLSPGEWSITSITDSRTDAVIYKIRGPVKQDVVDAEYEIVVEKEPLPGPPKLITRGNKE